MNNAYAQQGIKGLVSNAKKEPIGFVTIYCKELKKNTNSNADGTYELQLPAGEHTVFFQSMGYKTTSILVTVQSGFSIQNVVLEDQAYKLKEVNISSSGVNPAVWIMRKAISAAPYYRRQILMYDARVYVKGSGVLENIPFVFTKLLKKDGIVEGKTFLIESINEVKFQQPNTYKEKAISIKSSLPVDGAPEPMRMLRGSLYETNNPDIISPLSPQAFSVYNFKLEGTFYEEGREINRIRVIPKRKGQDVMEGYIYIIQGLWCIHSTDLINKGGGFESKIITSFRPVAGYDFVWMPITYDIKVSGGFLGFKGNFKYLAAVSNYKIKLNPNLDHNWVKEQAKEKQVIPTIAEKEKPQIEQPKPKTKRQQEIETLLSKEELSKAEMLKLANKMKRESELEQEKNLEIIRDSSTMEIDSLASQRDSVFWQTNRTVSLMETEIISYKQADSIIAKKDKDSTQKAKKDTSFNWGGLLMGQTWKINGGKHQFTWSGIGPGSEIFVNTVDGWGLSVLYSVGSRKKDSKEWTFSQRIRIPFERKALNTFAKLDYWYKPQSLGNIAIEGGSYISDFNPIGGASYFVYNTLLIFDRRNVYKIFQQDYVKITHQIELTNGLVWKAEAGWYNRYALSNINRFAKEENTNGKITPNTPIPNYVFPTHQATLVTNHFSYTFRQRYRMVKGKKVYVSGKLPKIELQTVNGLPSILGSDVDFMRAKFSITERISPLHWLSIHAQLGHQFFVYNNQQYFPDFNHAVGNLSPIFTGDPLFVFRQLDYYRYSNTGNMTTLNAELDFKRLLIKRLPIINMTDIREVIFYNGLKTNTTGVYQELGYSAGGVLGFIRLDVFAGFKGVNYNNWGVRLILTLEQFE